MLEGKIIACFSLLALLANGEKSLLQLWMSIAHEKHVPKAAQYCDWKRKGQRAKHQTCEQIIVQPQEEAECGTMAASSEPRLDPGFPLRGSRRKDCPYN